MRPSTGQTIYVDDMVGSVVPAEERFLADRAWREGRICRDYRTAATIEGRQQQLYGTACREPDGSWQRVS